MSIRIAVTGKQGQVARALTEAGPLLDTVVMPLGRPELDLEAPETIQRALLKAEPDIVVNAAAYTAVDQAEREPEIANLVNGTGAGAVAAVARVLNVPVIHLSTDYVFDGDKTSAYIEEDMVAPASAYGASKLAGEQAVAAATGEHVILRTAWVYAPFGKNFVRTMLTLAQSRDEVRVVADQHGCPTYAPDIAVAIIRIARNILRNRSDPLLRGIFHLAGSGETTWAGFAAAILAFLAKQGLHKPILTPITSAEYPTPARRPANSRLNCSKLARIHGIELPPWHESLRICLERLLRATEMFDGSLTRNENGKNSSMRNILVLLLTLATVTISRANLEFFGGVTDPGLYPGEFPFNWPDTLFTQEPYNQATCQDSTSEYQIQTGVNSFNGATKLGWGPLDEFYRWTRLHNYKMTWYGGYGASVTDKWGDNIFSGSEWVKAFINWVATAVHHCPNVEYINFANEPMHGGPHGAFARAFGGAGVTGYDWIINVGKLFRKYFPHAQLGINDFQMESIANDLAYNTYGTDRTMLPQFLEMVKALKAAGVVDWVGLESYSLETVSSEHFAAALNQIGALGVKIILTEFSPDAKIDAEQSKVLSDWQRLLPVAVANQYVIGITGPWTFRKSDNGGVNGSQWIVDDTVTPAQDSLTMKWLRSYRFDMLGPTPFRLKGHAHSP